MRHFQRKGNRIRASDRTLVFRTATGFLLLVFLVVLLLLNIGTLFHTDWKSVSLLHEGSFRLTVTPYMDRFCHGGRCGECGGCLFVSVFPAG